MSSWPCADEFQAGSNALLDVLEYSAEELHVRLMGAMPQISQAAAQVNPLTNPLAAFMHCTCA